MGTIMHCLIIIEILPILRVVVFMTKKSIKGIAIADYLADHVVKDYETLNFHLLDEDMLIVENDI
jgi:hypothetical protein